jgi:endo-1,4-beta-xylanase
MSLRHNQGAIPTRRQVLGSGAALVVGSHANAEASTWPRPSLSALARNKGLWFGSAVGAGPAGSITGSLEAPRNRALLQHECGLLVPENELKWYVLRRSGPDTMDFTGADRIAAFAKANGQALRGHTLLWHHPKWFPTWLNAYDFGVGGARKVAARDMLTQHVDALCRRYRQMISWDVVNETIDPQDGSIRRTVFSDILGQEEILDLAFHTARAAAPHARLAYNDYMSWEKGNEKHQTGVLRLLEGFRKRGVPVDALGVQSHIGPNSADGVHSPGKPQEAGWKAFLDEVTGLGYDLLVTEFDVQDKSLSSDPTLRDVATAAYAQAYLEMMLDYRQTKEVLTWGMVDRFSWLQEQSPRTDRKPLRPLPYDDDYRAKPMRAAIAAAMKGAPFR